MPPSTDERELFHYTMENIIEDRTRYYYWVPETSHVSPLLIFIPYHEPFRSTGTYAWQGGAGTWSDGKLVTRIGRNSGSVLAVRIIPRFF
ncbi:hypothetical protein CK203_004219 [Vitis vinifera]|uniref:Uncharacterized protein n=1 Tax=Vitis vinifera TaxID=29760 RepID=A0A438EYG1_VITVI|nr:hypothetical protein CK203_091146 [Vitis vinifera]RVX17901.1 hypothetical protein CK203_004219 [Vitis vinifera]